MTNLYKEYVSKGAWTRILSDLELPADTDEICIKDISHVTESDRQKKKELQDASNDN
jgi:hypothetical protein